MFVCVVVYYYCYVLSCITIAMYDHYVSLDEGQVAGVLGGPAESGQVVPPELTRLAPKRPETWAPTEKGAGVVQLGGTTCLKLLV